MDWLIKSAFVFIAIVGAFFVYALIVEIWNQVIMKRYKITVEVGADEFCRVANEILDLKNEIQPGGWLTREQILQVRAEIKRRREKANMVA
ncbi:MAG: hypothetical protein EP297_14535 [Gammaproteobacteria bacterium]|nr:MAG: hypothetical protein EP297_14535 [Gammaproteobacteria bacterium]